MPFFQVDDQMPVNVKTRALIEGAMTGDLEGLAAGFVWVLAGASSQASLTDGVLTRVDLTRLLLNLALVDALAARLVDVGLWHAPGHTCERCPPVEEGTWRFHDWFQFGYDSGAQVKATRARRKELKDANTINAVWARDCIDPKVPTVARCRYCGVTVKRHDRKSEFKPAPWPDHVDPAKAAGVRNLVVACEPCNRKKGQRTPAQAGMKLLPPPRPDRQDPTVVLTDPDEQRPALTDPAPAAERPGQENDPEETSEARPSPAQAAPADVRPATVDTAPPGSPGPDQIKDQTDIRLDGPGPVRGRDRARALAGSGQGEDQGDRQGHGEEGLGQPPAAAAGSRRGRRGRRGRRAGAPAGPPRPVAPEMEWDAGGSPGGEGPGRFGSPFHGWSGRPADPAVVEETTCPDHGLPAPCRKCVPGWVRDEGWGS